jgi:N-terminal acetyltransferase B complex catalytic subunit
MGKAEGKGKEWHGHITALTVGPEYRRIGLASRLIGILEQITIKQ